MNTTATNKLATTEILQQFVFLGDFIIESLFSS